MIGRSLFGCEHRRRRIRLARSFRHETPLLLGPSVYLQRILRQVTGVELRPCLSPAVTDQVHL